MGDKGWEVSVCLCMCVIPQKTVTVCFNTKIYTHTQWIQAHTPTLFWNVERYSGVMGEEVSTRLSSCQSVQKRGKHEKGRGNNEINTFTVFTKSGGKLGFLPFVPTTVGLSAEWQAKAKQQNIKYQQQSTPHPHPCFSAWTSPFTAAESHEETHKSELKL